MNSSDLYEKTPPLRLFFLIAIPGAISMIASSLWGLFDSIFVGRLLGETAFSALNLAFPFVLLNFSLADLVGAGSAVHISVSLGRQDHEGASNCFTCACILIVATGSFMCGLLFCGAPLLMELVGAEGALAAMAVEYLQVYALAGPFTTMIFASDNFLRICGRIRSSMALNILMSLLILGLEYLCLGVLGMGIGGSALAVCSGMFLCTLLAMYPFLRGRMSLKFCRPRFTLPMLRQIIAGGLPNFLSSVSGRMISVVMNVLLLRMGGPTAVGAYGVLAAVGDTLQQLLYGTCDGIQPAIGYNWGAGHPRLVKSLMGCCMAACGLLSLCGAVLMLTAPQLIVSLFLRQGDEALLRLSAAALRLYGLTYLSRWFGFSVQSFLVAVEHSLPATVLSVFQALVFPLALLPVLWPLGLDGIWLNAPITALLVSLLALAILLRLPLNRKTHRSSGG